MNKLHSAKLKFSSYLPIYGFWESLRQIFRNFMLFEISCRFEKKLDGCEQKFNPKVPLKITPFSGEIDLLKAGIQEKLLEIRGEYGLYQAKQRFSEGYTMFCAFFNDELAGFIWLNPFPVTSAGYKLKDYEAYHIDGWTFDPFRGKGVLPTLQQAVFNYIRINFPDKRVLIGHAASWNTPSISGQLKAGFTLVAKELSIVIFGFHKKIRIIAFPPIKNT